MKFPVERRIGNAHIVPSSSSGCWNADLYRYSNAERTQERGRGYHLDITRSGLVGHTGYSVFVNVDFLDQFVYSIFDDVAPFVLHFRTTNHKTSQSKGMNK